MESLDSLDKETRLFLCLYDSIETGERKVPYD